MRIAMPLRRSAAPGADSPGHDAGTGAVPPDLFDPAYLAGRFGRLIKRATVAGLVFSLLIHLVGWIIAGLITIWSGQAGVKGVPGEAIEFAVMSETELAELQAASGQTEMPAVPEEPESELEEIDLLEGSIARTDETESLAELSELDTNLGAGDITGSSGLSAGGTGGGAASFFGVEARGTRFAYIADVSGSMAVGNKIRSLQDELITSISALTENATFFVSLFNQDAAPLGGRLEWAQASDSGRQWAIKLIGKIIPEGGTNPGPAFRVVFSLKPRPDAIYFMTDGEFDSAVVFEIAAMNADAKIPIHCITFVSREAEAVMKQIAAESGGTYTHVPGAGGP